MKQIPASSGFAIFILFFGLSILDAIRAGSWGDLAFWLIMCAVFIYADNRAVHQRGDSQADH